MAGVRWGNVSGIEKNAGKCYMARTPWPSQRAVPRVMGTQRQGVGVKRSWEGGKAKPFKDGVGHVRDLILYPRSSNKSVKCLDKAMVQ